MTAFRRILLSVLFFVVVAVGVIAAFYVLENWRGARAWAAAKHDLESRGEHLDLAHFIPRPVPDEQNLALAPFFARELGYAPDPKSGRLVISRDPPYQHDDLKSMPYGGFSPREGMHLPSPEQGFSLANFVLLQQFYRDHPIFPHHDQPGDPAEDVLLALTRYAPALDELAREAATRPLCRFPIDWYNPNPFALTLQHLNLVQELVSTLRLRASVELTAGRSADALRDVRLALRLGQVCTKQQLLIGDLVGITCTGLMLSPVWQGLAERRWSAAELAALQGDLRRLDPLADYLAAIREERACALASLEYYRTRGGLGGIGPGAPVGQLSYLTLGYAPRGWIDQNKVSIALREQTYLLGAVDLTTRRISPKIGDYDRSFYRGYSPYDIWAELIMPVFSSLRIKAARSQTWVDEAVVACALERFQLDRRTYPDDLAELVPAYLDRVPTDVIDGAFLRYTRPPEGRYRLWSVGWNEHDDGGQIVYQPGTFRAKDSEGDWVWQYAPFQPPVTSHLSK